MCTCVCTHAFCLWLLCTHIWRWNSIHHNAENTFFPPFLPFFFWSHFLYAIVGSWLMTSSRVRHYSFCVLHLSYGRDPLVCSDESACRQKHKALTKQITRSSLFKEGMFLVGWEDLNLLSFSMWGCNISLSVLSVRKVGTVLFAGVCCSRKTPWQNAAIASPIQLYFMCR